MARRGWAETLRWSTIRGSSEAKRLREAACAWSRGNDEAERNGGTHPMGEAHFAFAIDAELLDAAVAFAIRCWNETYQHENLAYGLRLLWKMAVPKDPWISLPPARGRARARQQASLAAVREWIKSLPETVVSREIR